MSEKTCLRCNAVLSISAFHKDKSRPDGHFPYCKTCKAESHKASNHDAEKARIRRKKWATANAERFREIRIVDNRKRHHAKYKHDPVRVEQAQQRARANYRNNKERHKENCKRWRERNLERARRADLAWYLRAKYGLSLDAYQAMVEAQHGLCAICGNPPGGKGRSGSRLHVDHCHATGKIRSLLCYNCNTGLGSFKDDPTRVANALEYLKRHAS